jgi:uncharacterized protein (TIGR03083 family)
MTGTGGRDGRRARTGLDVAEAKALTLASWDAFAAALRAAGPGAAAVPTRLAGWVVEDLVRHTAWGMSMEAESLRLAVAGPAGSGVRASGRATDGLTAHALDLAWHRSRAELAAAFDTVGAAVRRGAVPVLPLPYGDVPLAAALDTFVMEAAVHHDDLQAALGPRADPPPLDPRVLRPCARFLQHFWGALASVGTPVPAGTTLLLVGDTVALGGTYDGTTWRTVDPHGAAPDVPGGPATGSPAPRAVLRGDDSTVLRVALGRLPVDALHVEGDATLAHAFKAHVPGP